MSSKLVSPCGMTCSNTHSPDLCLAINCSYMEKVSVEDMAHWILAAEDSELQSIPLEYAIKLSKFILR